MDKLEKRSLVIKITSPDLTNNITAYFGIKTNEIKVTKMTDRRSCVRY